MHFAIVHFAVFAVSSRAIVKVGSGHSEDNLLLFFVNKQNKCDQNRPLAQIIEL